MFGYVRHTSATWCHKKCDHSGVLCYWHNVYKLPSQKRLITILVVVFVVDATNLLIDKQSNVKPISGGLLTLIGMFC